MAATLRALLITNEDDGRDLIVGLGLKPHCVDTLIIMRTPEFEQLLDEHERGATVTHTADPSSEGSLVVAVDWVGSRVRIRAIDRTFTVDVSGVDAEEIAEAKRILELMNFDQRFTLAIDQGIGSGDGGD